MNLRFEHIVPRDLALVEATLLSRGFALALASSCPALAGARGIDYAAEGDSVERVTWFRASPDSLGELFVLLPSVTWIERVRWSREARSGRFEVAPELPAPMARRVRCEGTYSLEPAPGGTTLRRVEVALSIRAPLVARAAEQRLAGMLRTIFDTEAGLLAQGIG